MEGLQENGNTITVQLQKQRLAPEKKLSIDSTDSYESIVSKKKLNKMNSIPYIEPLQYGWLEKCGRHFKTWKWRYFELRGDMLCYYRDEKCDILKGSMCIGQSMNTDISIQLNNERSTCFLISTKHRNLILSAPSQKAMDRWVSAIESIMHPYDSDSDSSISMPSEEEEEDDIQGEVGNKSMIHLENQENEEPITMEKDENQDQNQLKMKSKTNFKRNKHQPYHSFDPISRSCNHPLEKQVKLIVHDMDVSHEWKTIEDPTSHIHINGILWKRGHINKHWQKRYCYINKGCLEYYTEDQLTLRGTIDLKNTLVSPGMTQCSDGRENYFILTAMDNSFEYHFNALNEKEMHQWIEALIEAQEALRMYDESVESHSCYGMSRVILEVNTWSFKHVTLRFYNSWKEINHTQVTFCRRIEAMMVQSSFIPSLMIGSQLIAINGHSILHDTYEQVELKLNELGQDPNTNSLIEKEKESLYTLTFILPVHKIGILTKKARSGFENWKERCIEIYSGKLSYYKQTRKRYSIFSSSSTISQSNEEISPTNIGMNESINRLEWKLKGTFDLQGCYINFLTLPSRPYCFIIVRSPTDRLILEAPSENLRYKWISAIYCAIQMATHGLSVKQETLLNENQMEWTRSSISYDVRHSCDSNSDGSIIEHSK